MVAIELYAGPIELYQLWESFIVFVEDCRVILLQDCKVDAFKLPRS